MTAGPVGFDLDMTLIDSRRVVLESFAALAADSGVAIDPAQVDRRLGIKLEDELAYWFPPARVDDAVRVYRAHYIKLLGPLTRLLPGAPEALAAVRAAGARAIVVTAKHVVTARLSLESVGLAADELFASVHGPEKATVLTEVGAAVYVGDTPADVAAAAAAGVRSVGVTTGSFAAADLWAAGADDVLATLTDFPLFYRKISACQ